MKTSITLFAFAVLMVGAQASQDKITLQRKFVNGAKDVYSVSMKMTNNMDMSAMGQGNMEMAFDTSQTNEYSYSDLKDDGSALVKFLYKNIKMKIDGPMAEMIPGGQDPIPDMKGTAKADKFGRMTEFKFESNDSNMARMMMGGAQNLDPLAQFAMPKDGVELNKDFDVELPKIPMFESMKMTGKVVGTETVNEVETWKITFDGTMKMNMDMSEMMKDSPQAGEMPKMKMIGDVKSKSTVYVDKASGRIMHMEVMSSTDGKLSLVDMGFEIPMTTDMVYKMTLKKDESK